MVHGVLIELLQLQNKAVRPILGEEGDGGGRGGGRFGEDCQKLKFMSDFPNDPFT